VFKQFIREILHGKRNFELKCKPQHFKGNNIFEAEILPMTNFCIRSFFRLGVVLFLFGACSETKTTHDAPGSDLLSSRAKFSIEAERTTIAAGETITFSVAVLDSTLKFDSLQAQVNGSRIGMASTAAATFSWADPNAGMGGQMFKIVAYAQGRETESMSHAFGVRSSKKPVAYSYEIVKSYPHNPQSFTQGLEWAENRLYEGTGLQGKSALMEIDLLSGKTTRSVSLSREQFGEGITHLGDKIYQITWQNRTGFVYNRSDFKQVQTFTYPTDGWGLTHWDNNLLMTDGTQMAYVLNTKDFTRLKQIEVWDDRGPVDNLNELETVGNSVWANRYQTDTLVEFDPKTGQVLGYADLSGLLKETDKAGNEDVLNGIAYHPQEKLFYVTGKNWPKLFAIRLIARKNS
jgi:glutaminyl-peptide cyclotransferase